MSITQDQILTIVKAGQEMRTSLDNLHNHIQTIIKYEIPQTHKRLLAMSPSEDVMSELESLAMLIQDLITTYNKELIRTNEHYLVIELWKDHYKQRYNSNLASRRWRQRRQQLPTPNQTEPSEADEEFAGMNKLLGLDEFPEHPRPIPTPSDREWQHTDYREYRRYRQRWYAIKQRSDTSPHATYVEPAEIDDDDNGDGSPIDLDLGPA